MKEYRQINKEKIQEIITCAICELEMTKYNLPRHTRSKTHISNLIKNT